MKKLELVKAICNNSNFDVNCRGLNNLELAKQLLTECNLKYDQIAEIPLSWSNQVAVVYSYNGDWFEFICGLSADDNQWFEEVDSDIE